MKRNDPQPHELALMREGAEIGTAMPYIERELGKLAEQVDMRAFQALRNGTLPPDMAFSLWAEKMALHDLKARMRKRSAIGTLVGEQFELEIVKSRPTS